MPYFARFHGFNTDTWTQGEPQMSLIDSGVLWAGVTSIAKHELFIKYTKLKKPFTVLMIHIYIYFTEMQTY